jgi:hypothetical protein
MRQHLTRRHVLHSLLGGSLVMPGIVSRLLAEDAARGESLAPKPPHYAPKAKRVIFLHMSGGVSHVDTFDKKPRLYADGGKRLNNRTYLAPGWEFKRYGKCGMEVSDLFPHVAGCVDDICLIRSMHGDHTDHFQATLGVHTGSVSVTRPSMGSWVSYGLGTENQNLPSFVVLAPQLPYAGSQVWASDFLPGCHQGTRVLGGAEPVRDLTRRAPSERVQEMELGLLDRLNRLHGETRSADPALAARVKSFETAFGMQKAMPQVLDLSKESDATLALYGLTRGGSTDGFGWQCLVGRRMIEAGVRFVELIDTGAANNWDSHQDMAAHEPLAKNVDLPIAGLLKDLKQRGLLSDTLVVWTSEFGRTPHHDGPKGRGHQAAVYSSWLAGAGVKGGYVHGTSDDYGAKVATEGVHVHDFHATILHLLGLDHERLTYRHAGRDFRLTDVSGRVVKELLT